MPDNRNRKRPIQVKFFVDENELGLIKARMAQLGIKNMRAYLRKMAIDGYVGKLDLPELRELTLRMKSISNSENQIAKRVNSTGSIYEADIEEIKKNPSCQQGQVQRTLYPCHCTGTDRLEACSRGHIGSHSL